MLDGFTLPTNRADLETLIEALIDRLNTEDGDSDYELVMGWTESETRSGKYLASPDETELVCEDEGAQCEDEGCCEGA
jgi:hypothetical protein